MDSKEKFFVVKLNNTHVGFTVIEKQNLQSIDDVIQNMMTSMGFVDVRAYLGSLPGYSDYLYPDYHIDEERMGCQIDSCDMNCGQHFVVKFSKISVETLARNYYIIYEDENFNELLLRSFLSYIDDNLKEFMFCVLPTLTEVNSVKVFDNVRVSYKWFCSDWIAPISYWV